MRFLKFALALLLLVPLGTGEGGAPTISLGRVEITLGMEKDRVVAALGDVGYIVKDVGAAIGQCLVCSSLGTSEASVLSLQYPLKEDGFPTLQEIGVLAKRYAIQKLFSGKLYHSQMLSTMLFGI